MNYIFDTSSFIVLGHYFPQRFPSFWNQFDAAIKSGTVGSVREVLNELSNHNANSTMNNWIKNNISIFKLPNQQELEFVQEIFNIKRFESLISQKAILKGSPVADPFVIASAKINNGIVVTEEKYKPESAKIPNICSHFNIQCTNPDGFMEKENRIF